jgi:hypothetical protein
VVRIFHPYQSQLAYALAYAGFAEMHKTAKYYANASLGKQTTSNKFA